MKKDSVKSANLKIETLKLNYEKYRSMWENETDDRKLFCNLYDMLLDACENMKAVDSTYVWVAFNNEFKDDEKLLKDIVKQFKGRG